MNHYLIGGSVALLASCEVVDPLTREQTPTDSTTVTFIRKTPDGNTHTYVLGVDAEVTRLGLGIYACTVPVNQKGKEKWRFVGTGACAAVAEDIFEVEGSLVV